MAFPRRWSQAPRAVLLAALASLPVAAGAGCAEPAAVQAEPSSGLDPSEQGRIDKSRKLIGDAESAISEKRYADARKMLAEARKLAVESHRFEIDEQAEKLDKREAKLWANEVSEQLEQKECDAAFQALAKQMQELESAVFTSELRKLVAKPALACLNTKLDEATIAGKYAEARALLAAAPTKAVLGDPAWKKASAELEATITEAIQGQVAEDVAAKRWAQALAKAEAAVKKGDATPEQQKAVLAKVRAAAAPELAAAAARAVGSRDAAEKLKEIDATIELLGWQALPPDVAALSQDQVLPAALASKHGALAAWVEAQRVKMKPLKKPEKRWIHGKVAVVAAANVQGGSKRDLLQSAEVWVLGQTKDMALVADADPGAATLNDALEKVIGWVPASRLASEPTADWIPPDDQLKGERVWGPLREGQPTLELGVVSEVQGAEIVVKRLADDAPIKVTRKQLRSGRLTPGTKILAFCKAEGDVATIFEVPPAARVARIQCEGGMQKEESLASLRSRADLLPPSK